LNLVGYLYDPADNSSPTDQCLGGLKDARQVIENQHIHDLVITLPSYQNDELLHVISDLQTLPIKIWLVPDFYNITLYTTHIEELAGIPLVDLRAPALSDQQRLVKRSFDILLTLLFLPIGIMAMGVTALAVWIDSGRPILFRQVRVGENGRQFTINKFRTMQSLNGMEDLAHSNPVSRANPDQKVKDDPRVTRLGRLLRRTSLDELPQLINVLKGEMSLVGPRPEMPVLVEQYQPWQYQRLSVPPGLTGWWQVSGRSDRPMHLHTQDDLYYIENYSVFLDLMIIARTVVAVLSGRGAY
jgi:exopolysaccharide biosynthesis polyprenyl glycosylphosphotransferase